MKTRRLSSALGLSLVLAPFAHVAKAHDIGSNDAHPHYDWSVTPPGILLAQANVPQNRAAVGQRSVRTNRPTQAAPFDAFAPKVGVRWDEKFLFVESNGIPAHNMMVGITAWQQQVPLPQNYTGANAWQLPLTPVPAKEPRTIKNHFLRGAVALAVNGIPIFNPQNNRGEVSQEIGELDEWGGHCGRADDYHYHAAPLHLQSVVGKGMPIAYALDGYAIYGLTEPDGTAPAGLDAFNGHTTQALGYHYHASKKYPYVNGGFHGEVTEREQQVDPQPRAQPVREALQALRGAKITGFESTGTNSYKLSYTVNGDKRAVLYSINSDGTFPFEFQNGSAGSTKQTYTKRERGGGGGGMRPDGERPPRRPGEGQFAAADRPPRPEDGPGGPPPREGAPASGGASIAMDALKKPSASFVLTSPEISADGKLPVDYTGDGKGSTLPLVWRGAPAGTKSFALVMDHLTPDNTVKSYWTMWDIPANTTSLPKNVTGIGKVGSSFRGAGGYEPPHSKGPGNKTYVLTVYALSSPVQLTQQPREVNREVLLAAMQGKVLASASLNVNYDRTGRTGSQQEVPPPRPGEGRPPRDGESGLRPPRRDDGNAQPPAPPPQAQSASAAPEIAVADQPAQQSGERRRPPGGGGGKPDNKGLIKPRIEDTIKVNIYADNWFVLFINGELVAVDSIKFTPHNVMSIDILPEYPMTIAVMAKDNADPKTGLEYGDHIGDGGFIIKFADGTVSNAKWKAKNFFKGPLDRDVKNPRVEHTPIPEGWWKTDFDDSAWPNATEYTEERVGPKEHFYKFDFEGAKFIWSDDLDLDNTVIFRTKVEKPGWVKRWNTTPDLDISGAPFR
jgi:hypothetical protein